MSRKAKLYLGVGLVVAAIGFLIFSATAGNTMFYMTVDEAVASQSTTLDRPIRMKGKIDQASISFDIRQPLLRFQVYGEQGGRLWVEFKGVKPDNMYEAIDAITEGNIDGRGVFVADTLMLTCPSTYTSGKPRGTSTIVVPKAQ